MATIDFFSTYHLMAVTEEIVPPARFFKDRFFPTGAGDIFASDKVLAEYRKGDRKLAAFVGDRTSAIPLERRGYEVHEMAPARIALSRILSLDDLVKRGFGEAIYANSTQAQRAIRLQLDDFNDINNRILRREEWMAAQTMLNNGCDMVEYTEDGAVGDTKHIQFYDTTSDHEYTVANTWDDTDGDFFGDVHAMCRMLSRRGLPAVDLVLGSQVASCISDIEKVRQLLDNRRMAFGALEAKETEYPGVVNMGTLNFNGFKLTLYSVDETYEDDNGNETSFFPATSAMVTAPGCGHMMYGQVTQIDHGAMDFTTYTKARVPRFVVDQPHNMRAVELTTRPLAAPKNYCPYIVANNVV